MEKIHYLSHSIVVSFYVFIYYSFVFSIIDHPHDFDSLSFTIHCLFRPFMFGGDEAKISQHK